MPCKPKSIESRFWPKVDKISSPNGCWLYTGAKQKGYGCLQIGTHGKSKLIATHRLAWELLRGPIPEGMEVTHNCPGGDNKACCNPAHLLLATHKEHASDTESKGQYDHPKGLSNGRAKLDPEKIRLIRKLRSETSMSVREIAEHVGGVHMQTVYAVLWGDTWGHVK